MSEFLSFMYLHGADDLQGKIAYVHRSLDYVDRIFDRSRPYLTTMRNVPSGEEALALLERDREQTPSHNEYKVWEFDYRARAYRADPTPTRTLLGSYGGHGGSGSDLLVAP
jgi:hypothetical protein